MGAPISGMTFHFVDPKWNMRTFLLCSFNTEKIGKSAEEHEKIIRGAVKSNDKLGEDVLIFSGTSDNEPSVALGVNLFLNFSGSVRFVCHSLTLAVNDAVRCCKFLILIHENINDICTYVKSHNKVGARLIQL